MIWSIFTDHSCVISGNMFLLFSFVFNNVSKGERKHMLSWGGEHMFLMEQKNVFRYIITILDVATRSLSIITIITELVNNN